MAGKLRAGLIGAGSMANRVHYPSLAEFEDIELVALCDLVPEKLAQTAERFQIGKVYTDYRQMLEAEDLDAVWILMPPHHLFDVTLDCIRRKKHVFVEKPPGITYEQTRLLAAACAQQKVVGMCGFNRRYIPLMAECRRRVEARGGVIQCVASFYKHHVGGKAYYDGASDILTCDAIHAVNTLRWLGGEPAHLVSDVARRTNDFDDGFNALMRFENGATGVLLANWSVGARSHTFEMHGKGISAYVNPDDRAVIYTDGSQHPEVITTQDAAGSAEVRHYYGFAAENRHFVDCIKNGNQPSTSLADAALTMRMVSRIYANRIQPDAPRWLGS